MRLLPGMLMRLLPVEMSEVFKNSIRLIRRIRGINSIRCEYIRCEFNL
ncbi:unnamed protein product [Staurois parvus]|uniref:Uncharacterized protein n=1 Tax=Staurois parvus TaxID=386267 RepID=A0ABN9ATJ1_9NEOB|nr:unnamed protein product [Staurois parvus]